MNFAAVILILQQHWIALIHIYYTLVDTVERMYYTLKMFNISAKLSKSKR